MLTELRRLTVNDGRDVFEMMQSLPAEENGFMNAAHEMTYKAFREWLKKCHAESMRTELSPEGRVPQTVYWFYVDGIPVGLGKLRHFLTDELRERGGHIGYAIVPSQRGKGYGKALFRALLAEARSQHLSSVLSTVNRNNLPSVSVMYTCGGKLERVSEKYFYFWFDFDESAFCREITISPAKSEADCGAYVCLTHWAEIHQEKGVVESLQTKVSLNLSLFFAEKLMQGVLLARCGERIVGYLNAQETDDDDPLTGDGLQGRHLGVTATISALYVRPEMRGRGVERMLVQTGIQMMEEYGLVTAWVPEEDRAIRRLYESFGFVPDGAWMKAYDNDHEYKEIRFLLNREFPIRLSRRKLYRSSWVSLYRDRVQMPSGEIRQAYHRIHYDRPSVCVVIQNEQDEILMIRSRRYATGRFEWEVPAGRVEESESVSDAARRECEEETGCTLKEIRELFCHNPANGMSDLLMHVFWARVDSEGKMQDTDEVSDKRWMTRQQIEDLLQSGAMRSGASMTALLYVLHFLGKSNADS